VVCVALAPRVRRGEEKRGIHVRISSLSHTMLVLQSNEKEKNPVENDTLFSLYPTRYNDVVVFNDCTYNSNRFLFPMNVTVGVDCEGSTRILVLALLEDESAEAYHWVLKHLMTACNNRPPKIFMTDQDTSMESAFNSFMTESRQANCGWHIKKNVERHATAANKKGAKKRFERARKSLSMREFEGTWRRLLQLAPQGSKLRACLDRNYQRQERWAGPHIGFLFTAGSTTTQRVKSAHNLPKKDLNSHSTLDQVFILTEERKVIENHNREELLYKRQYRPTTMTNVALAEFSEVHREDSDFLGGFARNKMLFEMIDSLPFQVFSIELDDVEVSFFDTIVRAIISIEPTAKV